MCLAPKTPSPPALPPPPAEAPKETDAAVKKARNDERARAKTAAGPASTILTSASGAAGPASTARKTLLGQ